MISKINIYDDKYYYKKIEYNKNTLDNLLSILKNKRKITLYTEDIFIKKYRYLGNKADKYVEQKINEDFSNKNNILFHYEIDKKNNNIYLYSLRNDNFKQIYNGAKELSIEPIQFKIRSKVVKRLGKDKNILILYKTNNSNVVIHVKKTFIIDLMISKNFEDVKNYIEEKRKDNVVLVVDEKIKDLKELQNINSNHFINLGASKYENI